MCTFTKAGTPVPGIKYAEGQCAALRGIEREADAGANLHAAARAAIEKAQAKLDESVENNHRKDWQAYSHGALDAVTELAERLSGR